jgi:hypothetical protein
VALASDTARGELVALAQPNAPGPVATWELGASVPAAAVVSGSGCIGPGSPVPALASLGLPRRPRPGFALDVGLVRASAPAALLIAAAGANVPLGSCVLHVDPQSTVSVPFTSNATGFFSLPLPLGATLPPGLDLFGQAVVIDPAGAFAGLAFTNGLQLTIGE